MTLGRKFAGFTECTQQFLDFKRLSAGIFPCKECASFVSCLSFSTLAHTSRLMLGGAIPDNKYNSSTLVANAVVLIVHALVPHLELDIFLMRLLRVATFIFALWMCCL